MASSGVVNVRSTAASAPIARTRFLIGSEAPRLHSISGASFRSAQRTCWSTQAMQTHAQCWKHLS